MSNELTHPQHSRMRMLEQQIETSVFQIPAALKEIRDQRLYRSTHSTFEAYCDDRWNWTRQHVHNLIQAFDTRERLSTIVDKSELPSIESHLREIASAPEELQPKVLKLGLEMASKGQRKPKADDFKQARIELSSVIEPTKEEYEEPEEEDDEQYENVDDQSPIAGELLPPEEDEIEWSELASDVRNALLDHFQEDELPTQESHYKAIAKAPRSTWNLVLENARERSETPKIQDYREAVKDEDWKWQFSVVIKHIEEAMRGIDTCNDHKPSSVHHTQAMDSIQACWETMQEWRKP